jgi:hypothetical protein
MNSEMTLQTLHMRLEALGRENRELRSRVASLEDEGRRSGNDQGSRSMKDGHRAAQANDIEAAGAPTRPPTMSRGRLIRGVGAVAAAAVGARSLQAFGSAAPALAANGDPITAGNVVTATGPTALAVNQKVSHNLYGFGVVDKSLGSFPYSAALAGHSAGTYDAAVLGYSQIATSPSVLGRNDAVDSSAAAIEGSSPYGIGVLGMSQFVAGYGVVGRNSAGVAVLGDGLEGFEATGVLGTAPNGVGVQGSTQSSSGYGVVGYNNSSDSHAVAVKGYCYSGSGVYGQSASSAGYGVFGANNSTGAGVYGVSYSGPGVSGHSSRAVGVAGVSDQAAGVSGSSLGTGAGVIASSKRGRGVVASGALAQLQLKPSSSASHPVSGKAGDLFVDRSARLWYCSRSGKHAEWLRLA